MVDRVGTLDVVRYAGVHRQHTARLLATDGAVDAPDFSGDTVLVARADSFPDSLAGSYLAGVMQAPVLLTAHDQVSDELAQALATIDPRTVVVLGGEAAVGPDVEQALAESTPWSASPVVTAMKRRHRSHATAPPPITTASPSLPAVRTSPTP